MAKGAGCPPRLLCVVLLVVAARWSSERDLFRLARPREVEPGLARGDARGSAEPPALARNATLSHVSAATDVGRRALRAAAPPPRGAPATAAATSPARDDDADASVAALFPSRGGGDFAECDAGALAQLRGRVGILSSFTADVPTARDDYNPARRNKLCYARAKGYALVEEKNHDWDHRCVDGKNCKIDQIARWLPHFEWLVWCGGAARARPPPRRARSGREPPDPPSDPVARGAGTTWTSS